MADYYPLLAKAVGGLQRSTPETRRAIYERARKALIGQLRAMNPPVPEADIQRENQALDDAVARLEREHPAAPPSPEPQPETKSAPPVAPPPAAAPASRPEPALKPEPVAKSESAVKSEPTTKTEPAPEPVRAAEPVAPPPAAEAPPPAAEKPRPVPNLPPLPPIPPRPPAPAIRPRLPVAGAAAEAPKPPPASLARDEKADDFSKPEFAAEAAAAPSDDTPVRAEPMRPAAPQPRARHRGWIKYVAFLALLAVIAGGIAFLAWRLRDRPEDLLRARPSPVAEQSEGPGKIVDRVGGAPASAPTAGSRPAAPGRAESAPAPRPADPPPQPAVPVALRAAMLVDAPEDPQKFRTFLGNVVWRVENTSRGPGQPLSQSVRAEADITDAKLKVTLLLQRNSDETLPASHLLTILFAPAAGGEFPAVDEIDIPQMRNEVSPSVDPLVGVPAKITTNMFLVGLARDATFQIRNIELLKTRGWVDIPLRFADGRIAKVTFEKGPAGDRAVNDAFASWGQ